MAEIIMNKNQAKIFAQAILEDIENYIKEHSQEYDMFLKEFNNDSVGGNDNEANNKTV